MHHGKGKCCTWKREIVVGAFWDSSDLATAAGQPDVSATRIT